MAKLFGLSLAAAVVLVAAAAVYVAQAQTAAGPRPPRGGEIAKAVCAACHGADGNSPDGKVPKLAAQHATYLRRQLEAFNSGSRGSDIMLGVVAGPATPTSAGASGTQSANRRRCARGPPACSDEGDAVYRPAPLSHAFLTESRSRRAGGDRPSIHPRAGS